MSSRLRAKRKKRGRILRIAVRVGVLLAVMVLAMAAFGVLLGFLFVDQSLADLPNPDKRGAWDVAQTTKVYSADHKLLANFFLENREIVPYSEIATDLANAVVAVEDERFYEHQGVDAVGILRAIAIDLATGKPEEGASTITQQYVRNTILADERYEVSARRKLREMYLASELEKRHTKQEILGMYLNAVYFGNGAYGAEAASHEFFGKSAKDLTLAEASMLAGLPQSPIALNPFSNIDGAKARQRVVLERMVENGYITQQQSDEAAATQIDLHKGDDPEQGIYDCHFFVSYVRRQLLSQYPDDMVFKGGLKVYTTIDTRLQRYAEAAVRSVLNRPKDPDAGLLSLDPRNGRILAMYGGRNYTKNAYNTAVQGKRQPGSAFKMFVLVTALEKGMPPSRPVDASSPAIIPTPGRPWRVTGGGGGAMTLRSATAHSTNVVFARLIWELGARNVARTAKRMGITSEVPAYPAIALGGLPRGVSPLEMASAYGVLAAGGMRYEPTAIDKIVDAEGKVIYEHKPNFKRVLSKQIAWATTDVLMGVVNGGTATRARIPGREVAGKTGTTQNNQDTWFCGFTPQMSTAVWMGYVRGAISMRSLHGQQAFGGTFCAPIWKYYTVRALKGQKSLRFARAPKPRYVWKSSWSKIGKTEEKKKEPAKTPGPAPKTEPPPGPDPQPTPQPPPPTPDPSGTPSP